LARRLVLRWALVALAAAVALAAVPLARADGDPASDVLYGTNLFPSYDSGVSAANLQALQQTLDDSKKAGYEIRVAVIATPNDLGSVTALWAKPKDYARFLGTELGIVYKGPVLIVMPNGLGFYHADRDTKSAYAVLKPIQTGSGDRLAQAATEAVVALAKQAGHPFTPQAAATGASTSHSTLLVALAIAVLSILVVAALLLLRRRRRA
jgi:hypothetical protein